MTYTTAEARQQLLSEIAVAIDELAYALACLGEAFELLDEQNQERLEDDLFGPVQAAYGRARRTHSEFANQHGAPAHASEQPSAGPLSLGVTGFVERAVEAISAADLALAELQDSMLPVEAGDANLRAGIAAARERLAGLPDQARHFLSARGR